jgi:hypothetical protein
VRGKEENKTNTYNQETKQGNLYHLYNDENSVSAITPAIML